jgi:hypothetical protein
MPEELHNSGKLAAPGTQKVQPWMQFVTIQNVEKSGDHDGPRQGGTIRLLSEMDDKGLGG